MPDIGERLLAEIKGLRDDLRLLRASLGLGPALGFGTLEQPLYLFINSNWWKEEASYLLYTKRVGENRVPITARDLTAYLKNVYRREQQSAQTGKFSPVLNVELQADRRYILQTGFYTNVSISLLAALAELEREALASPITLLFETSPGKRSYGTVFCRVIVNGQRLNPQFDKQTDVKALYTAVTERFGFGPVSFTEAINDEGEDDG